MKKFLTFILVLAMVMSVSSFAMAVDKTPSEFMATYATGTNIALPNEGVKLSDKLEITVDGADYVLDLNGQTLTGRINLRCGVNGGSFTVKNGTISNPGGSAIYLYANEDPAASAMNLVVASDVIINSAYGVCLNTHDGAHDNSYGVQIDINGTINATSTAVFILGNIQDGSCVVNINDGAELTANGTGIALNGAATLNIKSGAAVKGDTGVEVRAGTLNVTGGTIVGTGSPTTATGNVNGTTTKGAGIAVSQHTTNLPIDVNISGGTISATGDNATALFVTDKEATAAGATPAIVDVDVTGGTVEGPVKVEAEASIDSEEIISGGTFTDDSAKQYMVAGAPNYTDDNGNIVMGEKPVTGNGISVKYNGGNSFSTSNPAVPTGVEIDGVPVTFNGNGSNFSVGCISSDAKWVTIRWNSTSVTTNFTPDGLVECTTVSIPKTGGMSIWAAIAQFLGF